MRPDGLASVVPVVLCGGAGRRLRPLSTDDCPKPFLRLGSRHSMLQDTLLRVGGCAAPMLVLNTQLLGRARADLQEIGTVPRHLVLEPMGRNTAPALAAAALLLAPDDAMLVLPADHWIQNPQVLLSAVEKSIRWARQGAIISFGIRPRRADTGFGYIRRGAPVDDGTYRVDRFLEKPHKAVAKTLVRGGACDWNSGIFMLSAGTALAELTRFEPDIVDAARRALPRARGAIVTLGPEFCQAPKLSIDVAMMEPSDKALVVPLDLQWSDLGTWPALIRRAAARAVA